MWIGEKKIKGTADIDSVNIEVLFKDGGGTTMNKKLFCALVTEEKDRGTITDKVNHYFGAKFLTDLADYGLEYYMVENIAVAMRTLAHNLREELLKKTFNCSGGDAIALNKLLDEV